MDLEALLVYPIPNFSSNSLLEHMAAQIFVRTGNLEATYAGLSVLHYSDADTRQDMSRHNVVGHIDIPLDSRLILTNPPTTFAMQFYLFLV